MGASDAATARKQILRHVLAPSLEARGLERKGDRWRLVTPESVRVVEVRSLASTDTELLAVISVFIGVAYPSLGDASPNWEAHSCAYRFDLCQLALGAERRSRDVPDPRNRAATEEPNGILRTRGITTGSRHSTLGTTLASYETISLRVRSDT